VVLLERVVEQGEASSETSLLLARLRTAVLRHLASARPHGLLVHSRTTSSRTPPSSPA
jgi:hypothetical protein